MSKWFYSAVPLAAALAAGCVASASSESVSGRVTLNGKPVSGQVVLVGSDGREVASPLTAEGKYQVVNPPKGDVEVLVKSLPGPPPPPPGAKQPTDAPTPPAAPANATPPAKYSKPNNGLKFKVSGGKQQKDFELTP